MGKKCLSTCWLVLALAAPASGDTLWGIISTTGSPDPVTVFDLANPGGSNQPFPCAMSAFAGHVRR